MEISVISESPVEYGQRVLGDTRSPQPRARHATKSSKVAGENAKELAARLLAILKEQRGRDGAPAPTKLRSLVALAGNASSGDILKAVKTQVFTSAATLAKSPSGKFSINRALDLPVALWEDVERLAAEPSLLSEMIKIKRTDATHAFTVSELKNWLTGARDGLLQNQFERFVKQQIVSDTLPSNIGCIQILKHRLFCLDDLKPKSLLNRTRASESKAPAEPSTSSNGPVGTKTAGAGAGTVPDMRNGGAVHESFAERFEVEFSRLDRQNGSYNFVALLELRRALSEFSREEFDRGLRLLRQARRYRINVGEGRSGVTPEQQEASIIEDGTIHSSVSRIKT